jgi:predicted nuclease of predicted toxin-antitoxin system
MPYSVVEVLENYGFDVLDIASSNYRGAKDKELVEIAIREKRVILTKDLGYSIITFQKSLSGLWIFRVPNYSEAESIGLLFKEFLEKIDVKDLEGKLVILSPGKISIRPTL